MPISVYGRRAGENVGAAETGGDWNERSGAVTDWRDTELRDGLGVLPKVRVVRVLSERVAPPITGWLSCVCRVIVIVRPSRRMGVASLAGR